METAGPRAARTMDTAEPQTADPETADLAGLPADAALPRLLADHGGRLYGLALRFCGTPEDAEDLVQETFLLAYRKWHQFQGDASPSTWLYTIAARACQRRRRRRSGEPRTLDSLSDLAAGGEGPGERPAARAEAEASPLDQQLRREAQEAVERAISELPHHYRMPLVLKEIVELSVAEVAAILGLKEATVKTRVHRGRLHLRRILERRLPRGEAAAAHYDQQICLDLLRSKQEALDRGVDFAVPQEEVCDRCQSLFRTLDLARDSCLSIGRGALPPAVEARLMETFGG